jgi:DNA-binding transcriptional ArsR family regulator
MSASDLGRMRFAQSPLIEAVESLWIISSGRVQAVHQSWFDEVRGRLDRVDMGLLGTVVPGHLPYLASFLLPEAIGPATTLEQQLQALADMPADHVCREIKELWRLAPLSPAGRRLIGDGPAGPRRIADSLWDYWQVAVAPYWSDIRAVLDEDVAYRAATLTKSGVSGLLESLHEKVVLDCDTLQVNAQPSSDTQLSGAGLQLLPSVFVWPYVVFDVRSNTPSSLTYPARGVGNLWGAMKPPPDEDALAALIGRSRAAILVALAVPQSTTTLALGLGQSPPSVSQHLSVLRRSGLVVSWRSGRSVLYRRTNLATSIVDASGCAVDSASLAG